MRPEKDGFGFGAVSATELDLGQGDAEKVLLDLDREIEELESSLRVVSSQLKAASLRKERQQRSDRLDRLRRELFVAERQLQQAEEEEQRLVIVKIVSDSIPKYVEGIYHAEVVSIPGMRINQLTNKIQKGHVILDTPISIIHVGTNDVVGMEAGAMLSAYNNLISQIRSKSNTKIVTSALLMSS
ncbi:MAG: hypothetical protein N0C90_27065 [Candidatus Thiodiazotropha endolucinida]|nr:hypothetical protein [Candidatus Thiodiazotropha taylori]MCW4265008.1 hypothetical protein [Candidatus Thiodiazotropha endolucinida]